jgi:hypothetical protein
VKEFKLALFFAKEVDVDCHKYICEELDDEFDDCVFHYDDEEENILIITFKSNDDFYVVEETIDNIIDNYDIVDFRIFGEKE